MTNQSIKYHTADGTVPGETSLSESIRTNPVCLNLIFVRLFVVVVVVFFFFINFIINKK